MVVAGIPWARPGCPVTYAVIAVGFIAFGGNGLQDTIGGIIAVAFCCTAALCDAVTDVIQSIPGAGDDGCIRVGVGNAGESACIVITVTGGYLVGVACCGALIVEVVTEAEDSGRTGQGAQAVYIVITVADDPLVWCVRLQGGLGAVAVGVIVIAYAVAPAVSDGLDPVGCIIGKAVADGAVCCSQDVVPAVIGKGCAAAVRVALLGQALQVVIGIVDDLTVRIGAGTGQRGCAITVAGCLVQGIGFTGDTVQGVIDPGGFLILCIGDAGELICTAAGGAGRAAVAQIGNGIQRIGSADLLATVVVAVAGGFVVGIGYGLQVVVLVVAVGCYLAKRVGGSEQVVPAVVAVAGYLAQGISDSQDITVGIMGQLIQRCNRWRAGGRQGDRKQVVGACIIAKGGYLAAGIGDGKQVAFAVVAVAGDFACRVGGGKQIAGGVIAVDIAARRPADGQYLAEAVVAVVGGLLKRIFDRQDVALAVIGVGSGADTGFGFGQQVALGVVAVAGGIAQRIGDGEDVFRQCFKGLAPAVTVFGGVGYCHRDDNQLRIRIRNLASRNRCRRRVTEGSAAGINGNAETVATVVGVAGEVAFRVGL